MGGEEGEEEEVGVGADWGVLEGGGVVVGVVVVVIVVFWGEGVGVADALSCGK